MSLQLNIRKIAKRYIVQELRTSYLDVFIDVNVCELCIVKIIHMMIRFQAHCKLHAKILMLDNIYENLNREDILLAVIKRVCSGVRNGLREDVSVANKFKYNWFLLCLSCEIVFLETRSARWTSLLSLRLTNIGRYSMKEGHSMEPLKYGLQFL